MTDNSQNNKRIAKNTISLYFRHILIMLISLYTVRVILDVLGVEDYGLYNVVGGIVALFSFFNATMASASQRFFSFAIGQNDTCKLEKTFAVNWLIYGIIAILALVLLETVGLWFMHNKFAVSPERLDAVIWLYHFSVITFLCSILTTPFMALIIAHEDMQIYAYVSIFEALLKLAVVFVLILWPIDKLVLYGLLIFLSTVFISLTYALICIRKYKECRFRLKWDKSVFLNMLSYTGWSAFGSITVVLRNQAVTVLLNQMYNPIVVAARSIAMQVANNVNVFASNFNMGLYPPIVKSYAANDGKQMLNLVFNGSKITYFLMFVFGLPLYLYMPYILSIWLKNPPDGAVLFARLALIDSVLTSVSLPLMTAIRATGKVKVYELSLGSILIVSFVVSWLILLMGFEAYSVMIISIIATILMFIARLVILKFVLDFPVGLYLSKVIIRLGIMSIVACLIYYPIILIETSNFFLICLSICFSILITIVAMYYIGLGKQERSIVVNVIHNKIVKR